MQQMFRIKWVIRSKQNKSLFIIYKMNNFIIILLLSFVFITFGACTTATATVLFMNTVLTICNVFQQNHFNSILIFTCNANDFRKSNLFKNYILNNNNRIKYSIIDANNLKNVFNDRFKYKREVLIVQAQCPQIMSFISIANDKRMFTSLFYWIFVEQIPMETNCTAQTIQNFHLANDIFKDADIFVNSQIFLYQTNNYNDDCNYLYDVYRIGKNYSLNYNLISPTSINNIDNHKTFDLSMINQLESTGRRRRNLQKILFRCSIVILFPQYFTYMTDFRKTSFDSFSKWSFPIAKLLVEDLNFRYKYSIVNSFGWDVNGTGNFNGLVGRLQRQEDDFGMSGLLMRIDRIPACDFTGETIQVRSPLIFRKPSLSSISNIFVLPFDLYVWICSLAMCLIIGIIICIQLWIQNQLSTLQQHLHNGSKPSDILTFILGAMCQQGSSLNPNTLSLRITFFLVFMASIFLFTSYSANIVALLQTPSNSIKTLSDLIESPIAVGAHNSTYNIVFLTESQSPLVKRLFDKKIAPKGDRGFLKSDEGLDLVRAGMYAFQIDAGYAYNYISATFTEQEKCGLDEIEAIQLPLQTIAVQKHFPYRDLFTQRLRWQRECGLIDRVRKRLVPQKPKCESSHVGFVSVGLTEFKPALRIIGYGMIVAIFLFTYEFIHKQVIKLYLSH